MKAVYKTSHIKMKRKQYKRLGLLETFVNGLFQFLAENRIVPADMIGKGFCNTALKKCH